MDYRTFFFTNIASMTVFTVCVSLLAWRNRSVAGMKWFAASLIVGLAKLVLQGLEGRVPAVLGSMVPNELYLIASLLQLIGLHWFVIRKPFPYRWPFALIGFALVAYTAMYQVKIPYSANLINLPNVAVCAAGSWMLLKYSRREVSKVAAVILAGQAIVMGYRAWLTNIRYMRPWETFHAQTDPRWLYSLALLAFLAICMVMCDLWYLVTELGRVLAEQARTDSLTGALNRRAMEEIARRETARSIRHGHPLCMVVLDVDHFKLLNDTRGHAAGDCALQALVERVKSMLRQNDLIARTGGEEFTILLPDTPASAGVLAAERLRQAIQELELTFQDEPLRFTVSAGVAQFDPAQGTWESMMHRADLAMYEAKDHGRNAVWPSIASADVRQPAVESLPTV
ncbi:MAG: GGDEF domain-containing protein [Acidobacteriota bacterium]|nr:GGDEF domain-containing protein [Acidobacteriota bacterium]